MNALQAYFAEGRGNAIRLARAIGVSGGFLTQVAAGRRPCPPKVAVRIETELQGKVTRQDLLPDWREVWPELAGATSMAANDPQGTQRAEQGVANA